VKLAVPPSGPKKIPVAVVLERQKIPSGGAAFREACDVHGPGIVDDDIAGHTKPPVRSLIPDVPNLFAGNIILDRKIISAATRRCERKGARNVDVSGLVDGKSRSLLKGVRRTVVQELPFQLDFAAEKSDGKKRRKQNLKARPLVHILHLPAQSRRRNPAAAKAVSFPDNRAVSPYRVHYKVR